MKNISNPCLRQNLLGNVDIENQCIRQNKHTQNLHLTYPSTNLHFRMWRALGFGIYSLKLFWKWKEINHNYKYRKPFSNLCIILLIFGLFYSPSHIGTIRMLASEFEGHWNSVAIQLTSPHIGPPSSKLNLRPGVSGITKVHSSESPL